MRKVLDGVRGLNHNLVDAVVVCMASWRTAWSWWQCVRNSGVFMHGGVVGDCGSVYVYAVGCSGRVGVFFVGGRVGVYVCVVGRRGGVYVCVVVGEVMYMLVLSVAVVE